MKQFLQRSQRTLAATAIGTLSLIFILYSAVTLAGHFNSVGLKVQELSEAVVEMDYEAFSEEINGSSISEEEAEIYINHIHRGVGTDEFYDMLVDAQDYIDENEVESYSVAHESSDLLEITRHEALWGFIETYELAVP